MLNKFIYNYPDSNKEQKIVIFGVKGDIMICKWWPSIRQWVDAKYEQGNCPYGTISYLECDASISQGIVRWCYYSDFARFMNIQQTLNIKEET